MDESQMLENSRKEQLRPAQPNAATDTEETREGSHARKAKDDEYALRNFGRTDVWASQKWQAQVTHGWHGRTQVTHGWQVLGADEYGQRMEVCARGIKGSADGQVDNLWTASLGGVHVPLAHGGSAVAGPAEIIQTQPAAGG